MVRQVNAQNRKDHIRAVEVLKTQGLSFSVPTSEETRRWKGLADQATRQMIDEDLMSADLISTLNGMLATSIEKVLTDRLLAGIRFVESGLLVLLLSTMILLAAYQVVARNFFDTGILWGDALVRVLVLWVTFIGATIASRNDEHIRIDLLTRFTGERSSVWPRPVPLAVHRSSLPACSPGTASSSSGWTTRTVSSPSRRCRPGSAKRSCL